MKKSLLLFAVLSFLTCHAQDFWTEVAPFQNPNNSSVSHISIVDENIVWVTGRSFISPGNTEEIWSYSTDGGFTWTNGEISLGNPDLIVSSVIALSETTAFVSVFPKNTGSFGGVWKTENSGATWTNQPTATFNNIDSFANFIHFWDDNTGVVVGDPEGGFFEIYTTTNGGSNWDRVPQLNMPLPIDANEYALTDKYEIRNNTVRFATTFGRIFTSTDYGNTWSVTQAPIPDFGGGINSDGSGSFSFKNNNEGLIVSDSFDFFRTINGGNSWISESTPQGLRNHQISFVPTTANTYFSIGGNLGSSSTFGSSYSLNGGIDWINLDDVDSDPVMPNVVKFQSGTVGFCLGYYTSNPTALKFFKLTDPLNRLNGALTTANFNENAFLVSPNPTQDFIKINGKNIQEITLIDVQGKVLFVQSYPIVGEVHLDLTSFQNGVYFAKVIPVEGENYTVKILKN